MKSLDPRKLCGIKDHVYTAQQHILHTAYIKPGAVWIQGSGWKWGGEVGFFSSWKMWIWVYIFQCLVDSSEVEVEKFIVFSGVWLVMWKWKWKNWPQNWA